MESVREATTGDIGRVVELAREFDSAMATRRGADLVGGDGGSNPVAGPADVMALLADPARTALVGSIDDWVAGVALLRVADGGAHGRRGVLDACYVEPGARGVGVGHLLLEEALAWFRACGCDGVDGTAHPGDRAAKSFFEAAGFKARLLVMHRLLD